MKKTKITRLKAIPAHKDTDFDLVPDWRDCNPTNPMEQGYVTDKLREASGYVQKRYGQYSSEKKEQRDIERKYKREAQQEYAKEKAKLQTEDKIKRYKQRLKDPPVKKTQRWVKSRLESMGDSAIEEQKRRRTRQSPKPYKPYKPPMLYKIS